MKYSTVLIFALAVTLLIEAVRTDDLDSHEAGVERCFHRRRHGRRKPRPIHKGNNDKEDNDAISDPPVMTVSTTTDSSEPSTGTTASTATTAQGTTAPSGSGTDPPAQSSPSPTQDAKTSPSTVSEAASNPTTTAPTTKK
ncbi:unnamed protein product [Callosobruchus maculatus]|uniref:Uncharacterized protein n=2 Tax=Callosobruchus maculatus TaxID=64391 RepID=A0A653DCX1_CALMS|nr:unnamed protein product [Callosobruchus maculatus]